MRFAFVSTEGLSESWWVRLQAEGHEVRVFLKDSDAKQIGDGIVEKADTFEALKRWAGQDDTTVYVFDLTGFGKEADALRARGKRVLGASEIGDHLEERKHGSRVAHSLGIREPKIVTVASIDEAIAVMRHRPKDARVYFKAEKKGLPSSTTYGGKDREDLIGMLEYFKEKYGNIPGVLQEKIDGVVIDTAWWWNGSKILGFIGMIEYKASSNDDLGPATGSSTSLLWRYSGVDLRILKGLRIADVEGLFRALKLTPGEYDINAVISERDKQPYFLEWGPRFGWDADAVYLQGLDRPLGEALANLAAGTLTELPFKTNEYWAGVHVGVPPYPFTGYKNKKESAYDLPVRGTESLDGEGFSPFGLQIRDGRLHVASLYGNVGVAVGKGATVDEAVKGAYNVTKKLRIPDASWRTDMGKHENEDLRKLKGWNYEVK